MLAALSTGPAPRVTAPPVAYPRIPASACLRMAMIAPCPPAAATSRAVHTCSPFDSIAGIESDVPVPAPWIGPPVAKPRDTERTAPIALIPATAARAAARAGEVFAFTVTVAPSRLVQLRQL